jgi:dTDP-4-dehydrorhamnose reductase
MRVVVIGANGQLGTDIVRAFAQNGHDVSALTHSDLEITDFDAVSGKLRALQPEMVVNTA